MVGSDMNQLQHYEEKVKLLLEVLPTIMKPLDLGLHGGTLLNLFYLDMPRYSVDIDLIWFPNESFEKLKLNVGETFRSIFKELKKEGYEVIEDKRNLNFSVRKELRLPRKNKPSAFATMNVKIEAQISYHKREFLKPENSLRLVPSAIKKFGFDFKIRGLNKNEIFANKLHVACSRQAPKDVFDATFIKKELSLNNINSDLKKALIYNIVSYDRGEPTMLYALNPTIKSFTENRFNEEFTGINLKPFSYNDYLVTRKQNILDINALLTDRDKEFIFSIQRMKPRWDIYDFSCLASVELRLRKLSFLKSNHPTQYKNDTKDVLKVLTNIPELKPRTHVGYTQ